jgi:hypothetical protein
MTPIARSVLASAALALGGLGAPGCLANRCLLTYCDGPDCRCSVSTCGEGAFYDDRIQQCRCLPGRALVGGSCLSPWGAQAYCGPGYGFANGGCYANACPAGAELDAASGACVPREQVNQLASKLGVNVGAGQKLGCPAGQKLVLEGSQAACVPLAQTCARDEAFDGKACVKLQASCPEGSAWDAVEGRCVVFAEKDSPAAPAAVDVAQWVLAHFGRDGQSGTPAFCNAFAKKPWSFGVSEGSSALVRAAVKVTFPEGDIARGTVTTAATFAASGAPLIPRGASEVQSAAKAVVAPLLEHGGRAAAPEVTTTVTCAIVNAARPQAVPATGGL